MTDQESGFLVPRPPRLISSEESLDRLDPALREGTDSLSQYNYMIIRTVCIYLHSAGPPLIEGDRIPLDPSRHRAFGLNTVNARGGAGQVARKCLHALQRLPSHLLHQEPRIV
jgi:hypothetical protein